MLDEEAQERLPTYDDLFDLVNRINSNETQSQNPYRDIKNICNIFDEGNVILAELFGTNDPEVIRLMYLNNKWKTKALNIFKEEFIKKILQEYDATGKDCFKQAGKNCPECGGFSCD